MEVERERENEMNMGASETGNGSLSRLSSLLASKDRDFLLTSDDTQVRIYIIELLLLRF